MEHFRLRRGFTLIELLVVLAIIVVITSVVFTSQSTFNKTLVLANTAYDVALTLRSVQTYGLGSRAAGNAASIGYGLHFQTAVQGSPYSFTFFADTSPSPDLSNCHGLPVGGAGAPDAKSGDCVYTAGQDQSVIAYTLGNGITVNDFCARNISWSCTYPHDGYVGGLSSLDIVFARPNPKPFITVNGSSGTVYTAACLAIKSPHGDAQHFISVSASGQIVASATSCP